MVTTEGREEKAGLPTAVVTLGREGSQGLDGGRDVSLHTEVALSQPGEDHWILIVPGQTTQYSRYSSHISKRPARTQGASPVTQGPFSHSPKDIRPSLYPGAILGRL